MSEFHSFDGGRATPLWRHALACWLAAVAAVLGILWRGSLGVWFLGIGVWWLRSDAVAVIYALAAGLQLGLGCPAERISIDGAGWVNFTNYVPGPVLAFPGELMAVGGLLLIVSAVRRVVR
jgi:hypothetical protein